MPQSLAKILIHIVFSTKGRKPFLKDEDLRKRLHAYIAGICANMDAPAIVIGGTADHVHILLALPRTRAISEILMELKTHSAVWMKKNGAPLFQWQGGYSAFSVSKSQEAEVAKYIRRQKKHHAKKSFMDELRTLLDKHGIEYDEKYVWD